MLPIEVVSSPTIRETNGLAFSSRNEYLTPEKREQASVLYKCLTQAKSEVLAGNRDFEELSDKYQQVLYNHGFKPDYFNFTNADNLEPALPSNDNVIILAAAYLDGVRLIDNIFVHLLD